MTNKMFEGTAYGDNSLMTINDLHCVFNMPKVVKVQQKYEIRLTLLNEEKVFVTEYGHNKKFSTKEGAEKYAENLRTLPQNLNVEIIESEEAQGLPPYAPRKVFKVDEYNCPTSWMHGSGLASSYFVPIEAEHGMWLDFNRNSVNSKHVAILISVQGVNPLDGQSMVEGAMCLKQYKTKCPVHDVEFGGDRYCSKCGYKWVPQNYLCSNGTPYGNLWLDGFLAADGVVRQYYFTEEEAKGVAHQIIGAEKKVYSIGIAFYLSKNPKPVPVYNNSYNYVGNSLLCALNDNSYCGGSPTYALSAIPSEVKCSMDYDKSAKKSRSRVSVLRSASGRSIQMNDEVQVGSAEVFEDVKTLDIAAGAKINQKVYADPENMDFWEDKPAGMLYINYTPSDEALAIIKKGKKELTKNGEGFLAGLTVGK